MGFWEFGVLGFRACGVLVYELVMGRPPFEDPGGNDEVTRQQILACQLGEMPNKMTPACQDFICQVNAADGGVGGVGEGMEHTTLPRTLSEYPAALPYAHVLS